MCWNTCVWYPPISVKNCVATDWCRWTRNYDCKFNARSKLFHVNIFLTTSIAMNTQTKSDNTIAQPPKSSTQFWCHVILQILCNICLPLNLQEAISDPMPTSFFASKWGFCLSKNLSGTSTSLTSAIFAITWLATSIFPTAHAHLTLSGNLIR